MDTLHELLSRLYDVEAIIRWGGMAMICAIVFAETGPALFTREDSLLFKRSHVLRAQAFYEKYGAKTIVIARFVPVVRTFAPVVAGVEQMKYRRFVRYNVFGGVLWVASMILTGYLIGAAVPNINKHIHLVIGIVILLSLLPVMIELVRARRDGKKSSIDT